MFEVDVKNMKEEKGRRGPALVWSSDLKFYIDFKS